MVSCTGLDPSWRPAWIGFGCIFIEWVPTVKDVIVELHTLNMKQQVGQGLVMSRWILFTSKLPRGGSPPKQVQLEVSPVSQTMKKCWKTQPALAALAALNLCRPLYAKLRAMPLIRKMPLSNSSSEISPSCWKQGATKCVRHIVVALILWSPTLAMICE